MSLINGRVRGINQQEFDIRTGRDDQDAGGGRIYEVDPAVVAHFKAVLADQPPRKPRTTISQRRQGASRVDPEIRRRANELAARAKALAFAQTAQPDKEVKKLTVTKEETTELTEADVRLAHARFAQGESVKVIASELGIPWQTLRARFRQYGLTQGRVDASNRKPVRAVSKVETAVVPAQVTAVAPEQAPTDLRAQLSVIQELLIREVNGWDLGAGVLMLHSANNEVVTIEVFTGADFVLRRVANGEPVLPITCYDGDAEFQIGRAHGETAVEELLGEYQRGLVDNPPSMFSPAWSVWVNSVARASVVEQGILDWLVENIPAHLLREAAATLPVDGAEEMELGL